MTQSSSTYVTLQKKAWRGLVYNYGNMLDGLSSKDCLVCLTDFERTWLIGNIEYMRWMTRWDNISISQSELNQIADTLEDKLMSCTEINPFQIDYTYHQAVQNQLAELNALWTGLPSSLNPNSPDDFFSGDGSSDRIDALCTAVKIYVYSYSANWVVKAEIILGLSIAFIGLASITLVGGVIAMTLVSGLALISQIALQAMTDETALDNVVCCMKDALEAQAINQVTFEQSLDNCGFVVGSNEAIIRDIIASDLTQFSNYLSFLNNLGDSYVLAQVGVKDCPCDLTWISVLDFKVSDYGFVFQPDDSLNPSGVWVVGVGLKPTNIVVTGVLRRQLQGYIPFDDSDVDSMRMQGTYTRGTSTGGFSVALQTRYQFNLSNLPATIKSRLFTSFVVGAPTVFDEFKDGYSVIANRAGFSASCSYTNYTGDATIETLTITGTGTKPPQLP